MGTGAPPEDVAVQEPGRGEADRNDDSVVHPTLVALVAFRPMPIPAKANAQIAEPTEISSVYRPKGERKTPAGIEMNERISGVTRPRKTAASPRRSTSPRRGRSSRGVVQPTAASLDQRPAAVRADSPADDRPEQVAERPASEMASAPEGRVDRMSKRTTWLPGMAPPASAPP
jgi:hypothetical protein